MTDTPAETRTRGLRLRLPIFSTLVLIVLFGVWYYVVTQQRTSYYIGRNLRLLAMVTSEIDDKLATQRGFLKNFADIDSWCVSDTAAHPLPITEYRPETASPSWIPFGNNYLPGFEHAERSTTPPKDTPPGFTTNVFERDGHVWLGIRYLEMKPEGKPLDVRQPNGEQIVARPQCGLAYPRWASGEIELRTVVEPVLQQRLLTDFDTILLARGDGSVVVRVTPGANRAADPKAPRVAERASTPLDIVSVASLREQTKPFSPDVPIPLAELQRHTRYADVSIGGNDYVFFSQPYTYDLPNGAGQWFVCAFMPRERFRHEVLTISPSLVVVIAAAILLALCAWPFLKLALISDKNPVTLADAILLLVGILFGSGILTLMYADVFSYRRIRAINDYQHRSFALAMKTDLVQEIGKAIHAGKDLIKWSKTRTWTYPSLGALAFDRDLRNARAYPDVDRYPFFSEFAFADRFGQQHYHGVMKGVPAPLVSVARRAYFTEVQTHPWIWREKNGELTPYYVESVRSVATGRPEAVLSMQTGNPDLPVFTVTFPAVHVDGPLSPPGYGFAVIDNQGNVVFHNDDTRNGVENFFTETDYDRELRSAVFAREERFVDTRYLGDDSRIRVTPIEGTPWTMLTICNRRMLRAVNAEGVLITVTWLAVWILLILAAVAAVMVTRPRYRAPWLWPDAGRGAEWARLRIVLIVTAAAFAGTVYYLLPAASAIAAIVVPPQAIAATYLVLRRKKWSGATMAIGALWAILTALWIVLVLRSGIHPDLLQPVSRVFAEAGLVIAIVAAAVITLFRHHPFAPPRHYARAYVTCGALVVVLAAVLPTLAMFQATYRSELEAMVHYGQLKLASDLEHRLDFLADLNWSNDPASALSYLIPFFYQSGWCLEPAPGGAGWCPCGAGSTADPKLSTPARFVSREEPVAGLFESMPSYSDETYGMRALLRASAADNTWRAWRSHRIAVLTTPLRLAQTSVSKTLDPNSKLTHLTVVSRFPWLFTFDGKQPDSIGPYPVDPNDPLVKSRTYSLVPIPPLERIRGEARAGHFLGYAFAALGVVLILFAGVAFIGRKVLLLDLVVIPPVTAGGKLDDKVCENIFIVGAGAFSAYASEQHFSRVQFRELAKRDSWDDQLAKIEQSDAARVVCEGVDYELEDGAVTRQKIKFLDRLLESPTRSIVIVSRLAVPAIVAESRYRTHWLRVLANFTWVHEEAFTRTEPASVRKSLVFPFTGKYWRELANDFHEWVEGLRKQDDVNAEVTKQTKIDPLLSGVSVTGDPPRESSGARAALISDVVAERTDRYYEAVWATCSSFERLALLQIAQYGFANGDNRRIIRHLLARGIIRRTPQLRLFNDSFRLFVLARTADVEQECAEILPTTTTWEQVRIPLLSILVIVTAVFLGTQRDLLNVTTAIASALAAGFPALAKLIGSITGRRAAAATD